MLENCGTQPMDRQQTSNQQREGRIGQDDEQDVQREDRTIHYLTVNL